MGQLRNKNLKYRPFFGINSSESQEFGTIFMLKKGGSASLFPQNAKVVDFRFCTKFIRSKKFITTAIFHEIKMNLCIQLL
jgi:hypothetical protein